MDRTLSRAEGYSFRDILPEPFRDLEKLPRGVQSIDNTDSFGGIRSLINSEILSNKALGDGRVSGYGGLSWREG